MFNEFMFNEFYHTKISTCISKLQGGLHPLSDVGF